MTTHSTTPLKEGVTTVMHSQHSTTPLALSDPKFTIIDEGIRISYPNSCILWIEEIHNPLLQDEYDKLSQEIAKKRNIEIVPEAINVYHGTTEKAAASICEYGFDPTYNKRNAYGIGSYFAKNASYSKDYAPPRSGDAISFMFVCKILLGNSGKYGSSHKINTATHDSSTDPSNSIYVTPYRYGAIPQYLVAFYKSV